MSACVIHGDARNVLATLQIESVNCCVTSPPYWGLRDYGHDGQIGLEQTPEAYVSELVAVFREVKRVLRDDGTLWLNLGDSFFSTTKGSGGPDSSSTLVGTKAEHNGQRMESRMLSAGDTGIKPKDLVGIPWRVAFALQADGWYLRSDIIWAKPNPMPESVTDRPTKSHEYVFLLSKGSRYYFDAEAIKEEALRPTVRHKSTRKTNVQEAAFLGNAPTNLGRCGTAEDGTRNARTVWTIATQPYPEAHFATFPPALARRCIRAGCPVGGTVIDPFAGSGTTGAVAIEEGREFVGIELNPAYVALAEKRFRGAQPPLFA